MSFEKAWTQHLKLKKSDLYGSTVYTDMHETGCHKGGSGVPLNEETCDCYERRFFRYGYMAAKGLTPNFKNREKI